MYSIKYVYIQNSAAKSIVAQRTRKYFDQGMISYFDSLNGRELQGSSIKENLIIMENRGEFIKKCPCTSYYTGCGYTVLNYVHHCPLTCKYCIMQAYLNERGIILYSNYDDIKKELYKKVWNSKKKIRIGTGELGDSLALEDLCGYSENLVQEFSRHDNAVLELKTKVSGIDSLLGLQHRGRTVMGWSINAPGIIEREEEKTASLENRVRAAVSALEAGYRVSFHCDPAFYFENWKHGYAEMFAMLGDHITKSDGICWFSIGGMRFMPALKPLIEKNHHDSLSVTGEFIIGMDGKRRYYKKIRIELFTYLYQMAKKIFPETAVYFCMESEDMWKHAAGFYPGPEGLKKILDERC